MLRATCSENGRREIAITRAPALACEPRQDGAEKADADNRDGLPLRDFAATENIHRTAKRLAREGLAGKRFREAHDRVCVGEVVFGVRFVRQSGDAVADRQPCHAVAQRIDNTPTLVPERPGFSRELHPLRSRPGREVGGADATAFEADAYLPQPRFRPRHLFDADPARPSQNCGAHRVTCHRPVL